MIKLTKKQAQKLALGAQGLVQAKPFGRGKPGALAALRQLGYVQIDTISVIERAHHHALWSRVPGYKLEHLEQLQLRDHQVFEYWSHAAAYLPMEDYRFCLPRMQAIASGEKHWYERDPIMMQRILDRIKVDGPLMARDFDPPKGWKKEAWWQWKPAKIALEQLFIEGKLMVARRNGFHKVYDLPGCVLPPGLDTTTPSQSEFCRYLITRAIQANGLVREAEICYQRKGIKPAVRAELQKMVAAGEVVEVEVGGLAEQRWYSTETSVQHLSGLRFNSAVHLLCPFDNAIIQRKRIRDLFDFDYQLECYVPASKRVYGYYCLAILWRGKFVGRLDPKADRATRKFIVKRLIFEPGFKNIVGIAAPLRTRLAELAAFNGCDEVIIETSEPSPLP